MAMFKLFFALALLGQTLLFAHSTTLHDIRGNSWFVDANMTLYLGQWRTNSVVPILQGRYENVITNGDTALKTISLTFDDAPDLENTEKLLDILKEHQVKASFFMIGENIKDKTIAVTKRTFDEGHLTLSHSFSHPRMSDLNASDIHLELNRAAERIEAVTGSYPVLFRPPYGAINPRVVDITNEHNMTTVLWSHDSLDWALQDSDMMFDVATNQIRNGDIILMHCNNITVASLPKIIESLKKKGYVFVKLDDMLGTKAYRQQSSEPRKAEMVRIDEKDVVIDTKNGLMWQDNSDVERVKKDWQGAMGYCQNLLFAGYSDWRLPIMDDLFSIRDEKRKTIAIKNGFQKGRGDQYWSSSDVYSSKYGWNMNFENGDDAVNLKNSIFYVRCVRDNQ